MSFSPRREAPLILAAGFIAFVIWLIAVQRDRDTTWVNVPLTPENIPPNMKVEIDPPNTFVNVQFPRDQRSRVDQKNFPGRIDIAEVVGDDLTKWPNPVETRAIPYNLALGHDIQPVQGLPGEIHMIDMDPYNVTIRASLNVRDVPVEVVTTGTLSAELQLAGTPVPQPQRVYVTGSPEALAKIVNDGDTLRTHPLDLTSLNRAQTRPVSSELIVPEDVRLFNESDRRILINVGVQEKPVTRTIAEVPVRLTWLSTNTTMKITPAAVSVKIEGAPSVLNQISTDSFTFTPSAPLNDETPGTRREIGVTAKLNSRYPPEIAQQVKIVEVIPPVIGVEFVPANAQNGDPLPNPTKGGEPVGGDGKAR